MNLKKTLQYVALASLFLIPIFPWIVANSYFFFPFITGKAFYFRILVEIAFASWIILAFLEPKYRPKLNLLTIGVTVFALVTLAADLLGINPLRSIWSNFERMEGWLVILHLWMFYIVSTSMFGFGEAGKKMWQRWFNTSLGIAFIIGIYGVLQLLGWADIHQGSTRIDASLGNAAYMAVYMLFHAFIASYLFFARANSVKSVDFPQWIYAILAIFFAFLLVETGTRGTTLGLIGGVLLALAVYTLFAKREAKKYRLRAGVAIGVIILAGIVFWMNRDASFIKNNEILNRLASISLQETKTQARGYIWPMAIEGWKERPIFGWGQENFNYIFNGHYDPQMWAHEQWFDRAHSVFLDWLTASGIVGLLAYLSLYLFFVTAIWKSSLSISEKSVFIGLIAGYAIHNIFVFDNLASYVFFFALLGFASSLKEGKTIKLFGSQPVHTDVVEYIVAPIILVALVASTYFVNVRPIQANARLLDALQACSTSRPDAALFEKALAIDSYTANQEIREQILACGPIVLNGQYPNNTKVVFSGLVERQIGAQTKATPKDARIYVLAGVSMNSIGAFADAEKYLVEALKLSPGKQSIMIQLAVAYANNQKSAEALALMKEAYESAPENTQVKSAYASMFIIDNKEAEGRALFKDEPELFENQTIAEIYSALRKFPQAVALYKKLISVDPSNVQLRGGLAEVQRTAGMKTDAINTLRSIANDFPEYKTGIDQVIKQIQEGK